MVNIQLETQDEINELFVFTYHANLGDASPLIRTLYKALTTKCSIDNEKYWKLMRFLNEQES